jgi:hypothetical protein
LDQQGSVTYGSIQRTIERYDQDLQGMRVQMIVVVSAKDFGENVVVLSEYVVI